MLYIICAQIGKNFYMEYHYMHSISIKGIEVLVNCSYTSKNDKYKPYRRVMRRNFRLLIEYKFHPCPYVNKKNAGHTVETFRSL